MGLCESVHECFIDVPVSYSQDENRFTINSTRGAVDHYRVLADLVVVNYQTPDDLERFVDSLESYPPTEECSLTIVEVESEDYEHHFTWGTGYPGRTIGVAENIGYARACNMAAAHGSAPYLAFFNADVELRGGALDVCFEAFDDHPSWGILGPRQIDGQRRLRHSGIVGSLKAPRFRGWNEIDTGQYRDVLDVVTVSGSAYFIRRSVWDELTDCHLYQEIAPDAQGALLPTKHYYEETWLSYHAQSHGHRVVYLGDTTIIHHWHRASTMGGWADKQMSVSRDYFRAACDHHGIDHD